MRPPALCRGPALAPLSSSKGATPTMAAVLAVGPWPSSGSMATMPATTTGPMPGMERTSRRTVLRAATNGGLERRDLLREQGLGFVCAGEALAVGQGDMMLGQQLAQLGQFVDRGAARLVWRSWLAFDDGREVSGEAGVDAVVLGRCDGLGEVPDAARVEHADGVPTLLPGVDDAPFVACRGLDAGDGDGERGEPGIEVGETLVGIRKAGWPPTSGHPQYGMASRHKGTRTNVGLCDPGLPRRKRSSQRQRGATTKRGNDKEGQ